NLLSQILFVAAHSNIPPENRLTASGNHGGVAAKPDAWYNCIRKINLARCAMRKVFFNLV
ncbi:MAG: hypothetical protein PHO47_09660, partial [Firmicutes bacterium]|nr:hypothetical protein [Bacillota bacterium]